MRDAIWDYSRACKGDAKSLDYVSTVMPPVVAQADVAQECSLVLCRE